jgi:hypothetical protein
MAGNSISVIDCVESTAFLCHPLKDDYKLLIGKGFSKLFYLHGKQFTPEMIEIFTDEIIDAYKYETPQTILLFLSKASKGDFGKFFGQPDIGTLREWFSTFLRDTIVPERERQRTSITPDNSGREQARSLRDYIQGSSKTGSVLIPGRFKR